MVASVSERVGKYRASLRAAGMRPVQIWVPDTRRPGFAEECLRQSLVLRQDPREEMMCAALADVADRDGWA